MNLYIDMSLWQSSHRYANIFWVSFYGMKWYLIQIADVDVLVGSCVIGHNTASGCPNWISIGIAIVRPAICSRRYDGARSTSTRIIDEPIGRKFTLCFNSIFFNPICQSRWNPIRSSGDLSGSRTDSASKIKPIKRTQKLRAEARKCWTLRCW